MADANRLHVLKLVIEYLELDVASLTDWEHSFVESFAERFEEFGDRTLVSDKQFAVLERILKKQQESL